MIKKLLFAFAGILLFTAASAQTGERISPVVGTSQTIKENSVLKELSEKVNLAHQELVNSSNGTRTAVSTANNNYTLALDNYLSALESELAKVSETQRSDLENEIALVKQLKEGKTAKPTK